MVLVIAVGFEDSKTEWRQGAMWRRFTCKEVTVRKALFGGGMF